MFVIKNTTKLNPESSVASVYIGLDGPVFLLFGWDESTIQTSTSIQIVTFIVGPDEAAVLTLRLMRNREPLCRPPSPDKPDKVESMEVGTPHKSWIMEMGAAKNTEESKEAEIAHSG